MNPETRYARSGDVNIAYQVVGDAPRDLVLVPGWVSNIEVFWEEPACARFLERLASFTRLILFDKRGTGLSDRVADLPNLETRMDDVRAVMDTVGSERAALFGYSEGGPMCALFAATYPARTTAVITAGSYARRIWAPDYPWAPTLDRHRQFMERCQQEWGGPVGLDERWPSAARDERVRQWWARLLRMGSSPGAAVALLRMNAEMDVRHVLSAVRVPTLILHSHGDQALDIRGSRFMAERIPGAKLVELPGVDHVPWGDDSDAIVDEIEEFLTGVRHGPEPDRVLATVLFTDIVGSTERAAALGDRRWRDVLEQHHAVVRRELGRFRGREIDTAGDGFLATFDGPARGVRCARAVSDGVRALGLEVRAGLHTGEVELLNDKVSGLAVHIGARVAGVAGPGEVLVSSTVKDLVAGSGLRFQDRGVQPLKGVPGEWHLFAVEPEGRRA
ncbi:MAG TPA: adenylate/guanylate cyclase domain-containing protein [Methylomirabilota bacterium]|jgi:pimeloyl-ACP methyl ester carboxylesterase|nr:adenylate/guanylate cyclase domain-containing protein [Methylomirabilota bacterium]